MKNFFNNHRHSISVVLVFIFACGIYAFIDIKVSLFPEITFPKIKIIAENGEQPVDKMMITVTKPLENAIKLVPKLKIIKSTTIRGSCEISAFLEWGSDVDLGQQMIESRINEISNDLLPNTKITVEKMNPSILPVMNYVLEGKNKSSVEMNLIANYIVRPFLSQVEGISAVKTIGGKTKEYWVRLNEQKMNSLSVTPMIIRDAMANTNFITSNGYLADYKRLYLTITDAGLYKREDLENVVIKNDLKRITFLKDIADIEIREKIEYIKVNANGKENLLVAILKQPDANLINLSNSLESKITELNKILPQGVTMKPLYNQADFVKESIRSIKDCLWIGLLLAIVIAVLFLRSFRASATILIIIPATLAFTLLMLYSFNYTMNIMTIGAIAAALGLIIDDAIVIVEQIHRTKEENPEEDIHEVINKSVRFLLPSMIGSSLSTIVIFIPFVFMSGVAGAYFKVLTTTMIITLTCSFFITWIGLPIVYLLISKVSSKLSITKKGKIKPASAIQHPLFSKWVTYFIRRPAISIVFILTLILVSFYVFPKLETGFLPEMDEGAIVLDYVSPPGTSLEETNNILNEVDKIVASVPEVNNYSRRIGTQMGFFITEPNTGDYLIQLKDKRKRSTNEIIYDIRKKIEASQPALRVDFGQVIGDMLGDLMSSTQPLEIKIFGDDQQTLKGIAGNVAEAIKNVKGTADVFNGITIAGPSIDIKPDYVKLSQFNISPADFQYQLKTQIEGNIIGSIPEKEQMTDIRMIFSDYNKLSTEILNNQSVFLNDGKLKPVSDLAEIKVQEGVAEINRENLQSVIIVIARLNQRDLGSVMKDVEKLIREKIHLPQGYYITYGGAYAEQKQSFNELLFILIAASFLVFIVILFLYRNFKAALIILLIAVLGISGSYLALFITKTPLNVGSYTGLIMMVGIIGENAIFTFQQFMTNLKSTSNNNSEPGTQNLKPVDDAIVYAISTRLRPKLMTAFGTIIALMPLALGIGAGAQLHQPLAIAVIGGFLTAIPLLLLVLPTVLRLVYNKHKA